MRLTLFVDVLFNGFKAVAYGHFDGGQQRLLQVGTVAVMIARSAPPPLPPRSASPLPRCSPATPRCFQRSQNSQHSQRHDDNYHRLRVCCHDSHASVFAAAHRLLRWRWRRFCTHCSVSVCCHGVRVSLSSTSITTRTVPTSPPVLLPCHTGRLTAPVTNAAQPAGLHYRRV